MPYPCHCCEDDRVCNCPLPGLSGGLNFRFTVAPSTASPGCVGAWCNNLTAVTVNLNWPDYTDADILSCGGTTPIYTKADSPWGTCDLGTGDSLWIRQVRAWAQLNFLWPAAVFWFVKVFVTIEWEPAGNTGFFVFENEVGGGAEVEHLLDPIPWHINSCKDVAEAGWKLTNTTSPFHHLRLGGCDWLPVTAELKNP